MASQDHFVTGRPLKGPWPAHMEQAYFGMGCFWGAERLFWQLEGVYVTAVGYAGGFTPDPTYSEIVTGKTGHAEIVQVVFEPEKLTYSTLLKFFWEHHDPTQGMRQGNDVGTSYRSAIYTTKAAHLKAAQESRFSYQERLRDAGIIDEITTEICALDIFYYGEGYHQQYLAKNPTGYCGLKGVGVKAD